MCLAQMSRMKSILLISVCKRKSEYESETKIFNYTESEEVSVEVRFLNIDNLKNYQYFILNIHNVLNFLCTLEVWETMTLEFFEGENI